MGILSESVFSVQSTHHTIKDKSLRHDYTNQTHSRLEIYTTEQASANRKRRHPQKNLPKSSTIIELAINYC